MSTSKNRKIVREKIKGDRLDVLRHFHARHDDERVGGV